MLHLLVIYDDKDSKRGEAFTENQKHLISKIKNINHLTSEIHGTDDCLDYPIEYYIRALNGVPFIFVAYVHGSEEALLINDNEYINSQNAYFFNQSLFYACSCLSAQALGSYLRKHGCKVFVGYNATISSVSNETEPVFTACENAFITEFLSTDKTIQECIAFMYDKYQEMTSYLRNHYSRFEASVLENTMNSFEILCDDNDMMLTRDAFSYENY